MSNIKEEEILKLLKESDIIHNKRTQLLNQKKFDRMVAWKANAISSLCMFAK